MLLQNKTVLIVGGTSGIGRSLVETAANEGACVAFTGRNVQKGCELVEALRAKKQVVDFWKMDVQNIESSCSAVDDILNKIGRAHV